MAETPFDDTSPSVGRVGGAIQAVAGHTPWRSKCLEQAIAAKAMLRRRGVQNTLYLGVALDASGPHRRIIAHAWVRSGTVHVTGGAGVDDYAVVASYADRPDPRR
jgi:hypothetical protein